MLQLPLQHETLCSAQDVESEKGTGPHQPSAHHQHYCSAAQSCTWLETWTACTSTACTSTVNADSVATCSATVHTTTCKHRWTQKASNISISGHTKQGQTAGNTNHCKTRGSSHQIGKSRADDSTTKPQAAHFNMHISQRTPRENLTETSTQGRHRCGPHHLSHTSRNLSAFLICHCTSWNSSPRTSFPTTSSAMRTPCRRGR